MSSPRRLRRATLGILALGAGFAALALLYQWGKWDGFEFTELGSLAKLVLLFWSPYAALAGLAFWRGRHRRARDLVVLVGSSLVVLWGVFWHLDILVFRPDTVAQVLSPVLIPGNQWMAVVGTAFLVLVTGLLPEGRGATGSR